MLKAIVKLFFPILAQEEPKRARDTKGRLVGDNKKTPTFNEAWVDGKAPAKKRGRPKKVIEASATLTPVKKKRGRPRKVDTA